MNNHFTHKQQWPAVKARIDDSIAELQIGLEDYIATGFDCGNATNTLDQLAHVDRVLTPKQ